ncbi:MAG: lipopolysaccharide biosynthesis protein [Deltaproteobacteria bacterium]
MSLKRFAKDTAIYGVATILPRIISVLLLGLFTYEMKNSQFSDATDFWIFASFFNVLLTYGMETSFFRYFTKLNKDDKVINTSFTAILISSIAFLIFMLIFSGPISDFLKIKSLYFSILIIVAVLDTIVVIPFAYLRVTNRPIRFAVIKILNIFIYLFCILFFFIGLEYFFSYKPDDTNDFFNSLLNPENKAVYIFISNLIASLITVLFFFSFFSKVRLSVDKKLLSEMLSYGYPIMIAGIAYVINENLDKFLLKRMLSDEIMGSYAATYKIGTFMALYITAFRLGAEPFFFSQSSQKDAKQKYADILLWFTIVGSVFFVGIMAYMDIIAGIFIRREEYYSTIAIVPIILAADLMLGIYHNLSVWYKVSDRTKFGMYISIFGAMLTIILNLVLIPELGFLAAAWATFAAYGSMAVISFFYGNKYYPVPYKTGKIMFYVLSSSILSFIIFYFFYDSFLVKNTILLGYMLMVYLLEKQNLKKILNKK